MSHLQSRWGYLFLKFLQFIRDTMWSNSKKKPSWKGTKQISEREKKTKYLTGQNCVFVIVCSFVCCQVKLKHFSCFRTIKRLCAGKMAGLVVQFEHVKKWEFRHLKLMAIIWVESESLYSVHPDKALIVLCKGHFCHDLFWQSLMTSLHAIVWFGIVSGHVLRDVGKCLEAEDLFGEQRELLFSGWTLIVCMWYYLNRASDNLVSRWLCLAFLIW